MIINMNEKYQPYFTAYILHHNLQTGDVVKPHEYTIWNGQKWEEWRKLNNFPRPVPVSKEQQEQFGNWLYETVPEGQLAMF